MPAVAALLMVVVVVLIHNPNSALAATGDRMGGSSSRSSSSGSSSSSNSYSSAGDLSVGFLVPAETGFMFLMVFIALYTLLGYMGGSVSTNQKTSVLKLQVALLGSARTLQKDLDTIAGKC